MPSTNLYQSPVTNFLINGDMAIAQRATSAVMLNSLTSSSGTYISRFVCDRWMFYRSTDTPTGSVTCSQVGTGLGGLQYALRTQRNSGDTSTNGMFILQNIESNVWIPSQTIPNAQLTLSFWARTGANFSGSNLTATVSTGTGTNESIRSGFTGGSNPLSVTIAPNTSWNRYVYTFNFNTATTEAAVQFFYTPSGTAGANDYFDITGVMLQPGPIASSQFQLASGSAAGLSDELALCKRYCELIGYGMTGATETTSQVGISGVFTVAKRVAPVAINISGVACALRQAGNDFSSASPTFPNWSPSLNGYWTNIAGFSGLTAGAACYSRHFTNAFAYAEAEII